MILVPFSAVLFALGVFHTVGWFRAVIREAVACDIGWDGARAYFADAEAREWSDSVRLFMLMYLVFIVYESFS